MSSFWEYTKLVGHQIQLPISPLAVVNRLNTARGTSWRSRGTGVNGTATAAAHHWLITGTPSSRSTDAAPDATLTRQCRALTRMCRGTDAHCRAVDAALPHIDAVNAIDRSSFIIFILCSNTFYWDQDSVDSKIGIARQCRGNAAAVAAFSPGPICYDSDLYGVSTQATLPWPVEVWKVLSTVNRYIDLNTRNTDVLIVPPTALGALTKGQKFISAHFACGVANEMRAHYMLECPGWEPIANPYNGPFKVFPHSSWVSQNSLKLVPIGVTTGEARTVTWIYLIEGDLGLIGLKIIQKLRFQPLVSWVGVGLALVVPVQFQAHPPGLSDIFGYIIIRTLVQLTFGMVLKVYSTMPHAHIASFTNTSTSLMFNFVPTSTSPRTQFEVTQRMLVLSFLDRITNIPANYLGSSTSTLPERGDLIDLGFGSRASRLFRSLIVCFFKAISKGRTKESDEEIQFVRTHGACGSSEPVQDAPVSAFVPILLNCPTPQAKEN
ncbi:hypothetical protein B0H16DRAFT_1856031 [Mycena metata]|uniref:Uncharacterized protein n=1 Tax=Mycena metata TaxID=1033252 RepID=A0AAD7DGM8_9AGAR|nr:hypothetical protein B0H16DRAFT_1856031 [Mycena metata]